MATQISEREGIMAEIRRRAYEAHAAVRSSGRHDFAELTRMGQRLDRVCDATLTLEHAPPVCAECIEAAEGEPAPRGWDCVEGDDRATFEASE